MDKKTPFWSPSIAVVVAALASVYTVSMFLRHSVGVIAPDLARELSLSAGELGILSSIYFFTFAAAQIPLGIALDRFGPKRCMLVCAVIVVLGAAVFAMAPSASVLIAARALLGIGSSCYLMAPLALYARRFPPERFAMLVGIQLGVGSCGALFATAPLAHLAAAIGWRNSFLVVASLMSAFALLMIFAVPRDRAESHSDAPSEGLAENLAGLWQVMRTPGIWHLFAMNLTSVASFALIAGLWGGPYLTHVYGYDLRGRGDVLLIAGLTQVIAMLFWGHADRYFADRKVPVVACGAAGAGLLAVLGIFGELPAAMLFVWLALFGIASAFTPVLISHGKTIIPPHLVGRGMTLLNLAAMLGAFGTQILSGFIMEQFVQDGGTSYPLSAYRTVFLAQAALISLSVAVYLRTPKPVV